MMQSTTLARSTTGFGSLVLLAVLGTASISRAETNSYTVVTDRSEEWSQTITLPSFPESSKLQARLRIIANGDGWDRHGEVTVDTPQGRVDVVKFVTGFGGTYWNDPVDITRLRPILQGQVTFRGKVEDTFGQWKMTLVIDEITGGNTGPPSRWVAPVIKADPRVWAKWKGSFSGGNPESFQVTLPPQPPGNVYLTYYTSGHGSDPDTGCEFRPFRHRVWVDGTEVLNTIPWRNASDALRDRNPNSGRIDGNGDGDTTDPYPTDRWSSDYARSNWLPGDTVDAFTVDVTSALDSPLDGAHTIEFLIEGDTGSGFWYSSAFLHGAFESAADRTWEDNSVNWNTNQWPEWENWVANDRPSTATERAVFGPTATAKATVIDWSGGGTWDAAGILFNSGGWVVNQQNPASRLVLHGSIPGWDHTIIDNTATSGTNTIGARVVLGVDAARIHVADSAGTTTIGGVIDDEADTHGIVKSGPGTLNLSGANTYDGGTTVSAGTVNVTGDQGSATGGWTIGKGNADGCTVNFQAGSTVVVGAGGTIQVGSIPGDTVSGAGRQELNASGGVINQGTLAIGRYASLDVNDGASWTQNGGMSMDGIGGYTCWLDVNAGALLTYAGSSSIKVNPAAGNSGSSILTIGGTLVTGQGFERIATGTGSGRVTINGGALRLSGDVADLTVNAGAMPFTFSLGGGGGTIDTAGHTAAVSGVISGDGGLIKTGSGTLGLAGPNTYDGATTVANGTIFFKNPAAFGSTAAGTTMEAGSLVYLLWGAHTAPIDEGLTIAGSATIRSGNAKAYTMTGPTVLDAALEIRTDGGSSITHNGSCSGSAGLTKSSAGTLNLAGSNSYTGPTGVNEGTLSVTGSLAAASSVTVAAGATLGGTGTINGPVILSGTLAPGASAGSLYTNDVTFEPGSSYSWEIADWNGTTAGTDWDLLDVNSLLFNNTTIGKLTIVVGFPVANFSESDRTFPIATAATSISGFDPGAIAIDASAFPGTGDWAVRQNGLAIELVYTADAADFSAWAAINAPGQTMAMDHDGDGVPNGIEYFMGESGSGFTAMPAPDASRTVSWTKGAEYPGTYSSDYLVESSTNLVDWDPVPVGEVSIGVTVDYTIPNDGPARFARLKVTGP